MFSQAIFPGLKGYLKRNDTASRYFVQGKGEVRLGKNEFKAQGGEGSVYVKGSSAYKIYADPSRAISQTKIDELAVLVQPNIIRPLEIILDGRNRPAGYSMRYVGKSHALCQLFPKAFRQRNNLTPELTLRLVRHLQAGVTHVHGKGILLVDLNEMNFLVSADFSQVFFIDVDSYQTPSFPATVLMESVRDRHAKIFTTDSDWFSFAVVSFQLFVGIHPFRGTYPPLQHLTDSSEKLDVRMQRNVSVLHAGVSVPSACLPFSVIPPVYLDWYRAVLEQGRRLPPPENVTAAIVLTEAYVTRNVGSGTFIVQEIREFDGEIVWHDGVITTTEQSIYFAGKRYPKPPFDVKLVVSPRLRHLIAVYNDGSRFKFHDLTTDRIIETGIEGEEVIVGHGQVYLKQHENIFAIDFIELPHSLLLGLRSVANVMLKSTRMFAGVAFQDLLGANYASIPTADGMHQVRLPELDGARIVDARLYRHVLVVVVSTSGRYDKYIFRFAKGFSSHDVRPIRDITTADIEFTVLENGLVLHLAEDNQLELFSSLQDSVKIRTIKDKALEGDLKLFHTGSQALMARGNKLYKFNLRSEA